MNETPILWTEKTWNPWSGCRPVSPGCKHCYARLLAENKRGTRAFPNGFDLTMRPHKLTEPLRLKKPSLIFCNSMSDMFFEDVTDAQRDAAMNAIEAAPWHRYQILTKRPLLAAEYAKRRPLPRTVWLGVTVESQEHASRIAALRDIDATVRFISAEPLLSELDVRGLLDDIHWVIGGGESGPHLTCGTNPRAMVRRGGRGEPRWVPTDEAIGRARKLRDACSDSGSLFFWKQWGGPTPKSAGRTLDGKIYDAMPSKTTAE